MHWEIIGWIILAVASLDVFLTVLYARDQVGIIVPWINRGTWFLVRRVARVRHPAVTYALTFCGPVFVLINPTIWAALYILGFAFVYFPMLGTGIKAAQGLTDTGFLTAIYYSGFCFSTLGLGDLTPITDRAELLSVAQCLLGFALVTMVLTYLQSVYRAVVEQNSLGSYLNALTGFSGDAAVLLKRAYDADKEADLALNLSNQLQSVKERHHSYPIIQYFRFRESEYSIVRMLAICLDAASLHQALERSMETSRHKMLVLGDAATDVAASLYPKLPSSRGKTSSADRSQEATSRMWRDRFREAVDSLTGARWVDEADLEDAEHYYLELRGQWGARLMELCDLLAISWEAADPATAAVADGASKSDDWHAQRANAFNGRFSADSRPQNENYLAQSTGSASEQDSDETPDSTAS